MNRKWIFLILIPLLSACVGQVGDKTITLEEPTSPKEQQEKSSVPERSTIVRLGEKGFSADVMLCNEAGKNGLVIVLAELATGFSSGDCNQNLTLQTLSLAGYRAIAVNSPGSGKTLPGRFDFFGNDSIKLLELVLTQYKNENKIIWAEGFATSVAVNASRNRTDVRTLVLGNGVYDLEKYRSSKENAFDAQALAVEKEETAAAFDELRSVAWDTSGISAKVVLFHDKGDPKLSPIDQTKLFRDSLAANQGNVKYFEVESKNGASANQKVGLIKMLLQELM